MKKNLKRVLAVVLVVCSLMSYTLPTANAGIFDWIEDYIGGGSSTGNTTNEIVYDFVQLPYEGGIYTGLGESGQMYQTLLGGDYLTGCLCTSSIPARYAMADGETYALNWTYESASAGMRRTTTGEDHLPGTNVRFVKTNGLRSVMDQDQWIAFRIKSPGEGTFAVDLTYYGYTGSGTMAFYILEAEPNASIDRDVVLTRAEKIQAAMDPDNRVGMVDLYNGTANKSNSAFIGNWTFEADKEYVVVMECYEPAPCPDNRYVYLTNLTMTAGEKTATEAAEERVRALTVKENVITVADPGTMAALWEVDGQDYYYLPIEGGQLLIFNLDTWELVKRVETGISYPTSTAVVEYTDINGKQQTELFIGGNGKRMFGYNLYTGKTRFTPYYNYTGGLEKEQAIRGITAYNSMVYVGLSFEGHLAQYDPVTNQYTDLGDMIQESFSEIEGEDGEVTGDATGGISAIACYGDYLYLTATSLNTKYIIKYDLVNKKKVAQIDVSAQIGPNTGVKGMNVLGDGDYLIAGGIGFLSLALIDLDTFTRVSNTQAKALGLDDTACSKGMNGFATNVVENKQYFVAGGCVYAYNTLTDRFENIGGGFNGFNTAGKQWVTMSVNGGAEQLYLFSYTTAGQVRLCDPAVGKKISLDGLMKPEYGTNGAVLRLNTTGEGADANTLYLGAFNTPGAAAYNTATGEIRYYRTEGQTDSQVWLDGKLYAGNYSQCVVYEIDMENSDNNKAVISNMVGYEQKRIHTLAAGDGYIFAGTIPTTSLYGGGIGIYNTATGEEDFIRFKETSVNGEKVVPNEELWDLSVKGLVYQNGLLYGSTTRSGGTGANGAEGTSAQIFVYDYKNQNILSTLDLRNYISDYLPSTIDAIDFIGGITADPVVAGRFWGIVSDVLFTFTYNRNDNEWSVDVVQDQDHTKYNSTGNRAWFDVPIVFDTSSNSIYVCFVSSGIHCITLSNWNTAKVASSVRITADKPLQYAMGADNMLYYINGANLKTVAVNVKAADWAVAQAWDAQVDAIGTITANSAATIANVRAAYENLSLRNKCLVQNMAALEEAEAELLEKQIDAEVEALSSDSVEVLESYIAQYDSMTARQQRYVKNYTVLTQAYAEAVELREAEEEQVATVQAQINALNVTSVDDAAAVTAAREAYEALSDSQKAKVDITALTAAEARLATLVSAAEVQAQIDALPDSATLVDEAAVAAVRTAYDALTDEAKAEVTTTKLEAAEARIAELKAAQAVQEQINALPSPITLTDEETVAAARAAYDALDAQVQATVTNLSVLEAAETAIAELKAVQAVQERINALPESVTVADKYAILAVREAYEALSSEQQDTVTTAKLEEAEAQLEDLMKAFPSAQFYNFELYKNTDFTSGFTYAAANTNFYGIKPYNNTISIEQWFYNNYPGTINWGMETAAGNNSTLQDYMFRGATDQGLRILTYEIGQYATLRIHVPAAGKYTVSLQGGGDGSTSDIYIFEAATGFTTARTSTATIVAAMTAENQIADNLVLKANAEAALGEWTFPEAGDYIVVFEAAVAYKNGISIRNMTLTPMVNADTAVAMVGEEYFLSLDEAFAYQVENSAEAVLLNKNVELGDLILPSGAVLDLNGKILTVDSVLTYASSGIMDSSEKDTGVLVINDADGNMISSDNTQLPIYDAAAGGLRFFEISVQSVAVTGNKSNNPKYWFKVNCINFAEIYKLIQAGSELNITAKMTWNGGEADAVASIEFLNKWAEEYSNNEKIYITVSTVNTENLENFSLIPALAANGVAISGDDMHRDALSF